MSTIELSRLPEKIEFLINIEDVNTPGYVLIRMRGRNFQLVSVYGGRNMAKSQVKR